MTIFFNTLKSTLVIKGIILTSAHRKVYKLGKYIRKDV